MFSFGGKPKTADEKKAEMKENVRGAHLPCSLQRLCSACSGLFLALLHSNLQLTPQLVLLFSSSLSLSLSLSLCLSLSLYAPPSWLDLLQFKKWKAVVKAGIKDQERSIRSERRRTPLGSCSAAQSTPFLLSHINPHAAPLCFSPHSSPCGLLLPTCRHQGHH
jgi:hypothetical protein